MTVGKYCQQLKDGNETKASVNEYPYLASLNYYTSMAHFVGKKLGMRPSELLDTWNCAELLVAYGEYSNEMSMKNYIQWKSLDPQTRRKGERPDKYNVRFYTKGNDNG